ncbi:class I SAM-dependent methyltransferase [Luteibacter aegosomatissinici]|uniref:class I SAM-dependent methyltransferase n=1 Tax=Luteibacter aegosomatissinici TaxID=2911539 RepID=UPI001FF71A03|nr:methyltransferase domain-containing protein [Luteibacter aegosomatissinici]UPG95356.1 class I SAM-dependent methyltransferase [Luteibacter aegosomatissinici]
MDLQTLYRGRFPEADLAKKNAIWRVICRTFLCRFVSTTDTVVDVGAGYCEFINNIDAASKIAVDLNPDVRRFASADVTVINESCTSIATLQAASVDVVFMSNFLEHLPDKQLVLDTFIEAHRILRAGGRILILQPNIRFVGGEYWDFFDHHTPLTDRSLVEALQMTGFRVTTCIPQFLPYTTRSALPQHPLLVKLYLHVPFIWRLLGKQAFVIGTVETSV